MTENVEVNKYNQSLDSNENNAVNDLLNLKNSNDLLSEIKQDKTLSRLVNTHFKSWNESSLNNYSKVGINTETLQEQLIGVGFDLGSTGADGDFGKMTFVAIIMFQKKMGLKPTGVANITILKYLFPRKFRSLNSQAGFTQDGIKLNVQERIKKYDDELKKEKEPVIKETKLETQKIKKETQEIQKAEVVKLDNNTNESVKHYKKEIKTIITKENPFINYEKKEALSNAKKIVSFALNAVENKNKLNAEHCTDWIDKVYEETTGESVYNSNTLFNGVKKINKGTGIGVEKYATKSDIGSIKAGDHIMLDRPKLGKYGVGKTHSILALGSPNNGIVEAITYSKYNTPPIKVYYDLYGRGRAKSGKPIRIQRSA